MNCELLHFFGLLLHCEEALTYSEACGEEDEGEIGEDSHYTGDMTMMISISLPHVRMASYCLTTSLETIILDLQEVLFWCIFQKLEMEWTNGRIQHCILGIQHGSCVVVYNMFFGKYYVRQERPSDAA